MRAERNSAPPEGTLGALFVKKGNASNATGFHHEIARPRAYDRLRPHKPFVIVAVLGLALLLTNFGRITFWLMKGTRLCSRSVFEIGVPKAWELASRLQISDLGAREEPAAFMVSAPWVQYLRRGPASFFLFGQNTFSARLPFALAGWFNGAAGFPAWSGD